MSEAVAPITLDTSGNARVQTQSSGGGTLPITESHSLGGYDDISTIYAYYTPEQQVALGKHCEHWTVFGHRPEARPYRTGEERAFIEQVEAENPGKFASYLISWSGCD